MNKKNTVKKAGALFLGLALTLGATGCNFLVTDAELDYAQEIARVNISETLKSDEDYKDYAKDIGDILEQVPASIVKRDLVSYYMSVGYQYVESYGYSYKDTFEMLLDGLVSREIMIQYAIAYYLKADNGLTKAGWETYTKDASNKEIATLKYFLTDGGENAEDYDRAEYGLKKSFNDSLDSMEASYIKAEEEGEHNHGSRTTPTGVDGEKEDYYTTDYKVYTGRNVAGDCGEYERVEGSTTASRQKAYNRFLANLQGYSLIGDDENTADITKLKYYEVELASALGQALIEKYYEDLEDTALAQLTGEYVSDKYEKLVKEQQEKYENDPDGFATAMDSVSDTSFLVYGLENYGFVYNILLPFSQSQTIEYNEAKNRGLSQDALYSVRRDILKKVTGKDLRSDWVDEHDHANHAYKAEDGKWYFFENNTTNLENSKYEALDHYMGVLPFGGKINEDTMEVENNPTVSVDYVLGLYLEYAQKLGLSYTEDESFKTNYETVTTFTKEETNDKTGKVEKVVDYSNFMYRAGKITVDSNPAHYFKKDTDFYKLLSYANELMFAYSTDTGCLNKYMGYSVSPYTTSYMKEFEYAAQWAVKEAIEEGGTAFAVAPTDYGWHIIITTFVYGEDGKVYGDYNHEEKDTKGTFSNLYYESLKSSVVNQYTAEKEKSVLKEYNTEKSVTKFESRYKDLMEMDA